MELLTYVLLIIIAILLFFLLKKERVLGINTEVKIEDKKLDEDESKKYRETIYNLLNYNIGLLGIFFSECLETYSESK